MVGVLFEIAPDLAAAFFMPGQIVTKPPESPLGREWGVADKVTRLRSDIRITTVRITGQGYIRQAERAR